MDVYFQNNYGAPVMCIHVYSDPQGCQAYPEKWMIRAWMRLNPGEKKYAFSTTSTTFYYYAYAIEGQARIWAGTDKYVTITPGIEIYQCADVPNPGGQVYGLRQTDAGQPVQTFIQYLA